MIFHAEKKHRPKITKAQMKGLLAEGAVGEILIAGICLLCYGKFVWLFPLQLLFIPYFSYVKKKKREKTHKKYRQGFLNLLQSLMTSLQTGYSLENACRRSYQEMEELYKEEKHPMMEPLYEIVVGLELQIPAEKLFHTFAGKTQLKEIHQFAVVLEIAAATGGDLVDIIRNTIEHLNTKIEAEQEIEVLLSGKIYEKNIMLGMPFLILLYLRIANPGYLDVFYQTLPGQFLMTVFLGIVLLCFFWAERILYRCMT